MTATEAVMAGAALLDVQDPGWRERIDPEGLHLADCKQCVLGQLYGHYRKGLRRHRIADGALYGFTIWLGDGSERSESARFGALTKAWRRLLTDVAA